VEDLRFVPSPPELEPIRTRTAELNFTMASESLTGALLRVLAASKPGGRLLELGTGTGVGTAWLLAGMDASSTLVSVDVDPMVQAVARETLGHDRRLNLVTSDGAAFLWRQKPGSFDLIFADAMPGKYEALDEALELVRRGGFYVIDDMLPQPNWPEGHAEKVPVLMKQLAARSDFEMVPMVWASGVIIMVRK
jgi:predicted O-methyltransferase YrrM